MHSSSQLSSSVALRHIFHFRVTFILPRPIAQSFIIRLFCISLSIIVNNYLWERKKQQSIESRAGKLTAGTQKLGMGWVVLARSDPNWMGDRMVKRSHGGVASCPAAAAEFQHTRFTPLKRFLSWRRVHACCVRNCNKTARVERQQEASRS